MTKDDSTITRDNIDALSFGMLRGRSLLQRKRATRICSADRRRHSRAADRVPSTATIRLVGSAAGGHHPRMIPMVQTHQRIIKKAIKPTTKTMIAVQMHRACGDHASH
jgi:hypothetical protein